MRPRAILLVSLTVVLACTRPVHRRTYVLAADAGGYDHPAQVPEAVVRLAIAGRVDAADQPGLPRAMVAAFRRMTRAQVVYYRHPGGGAWLFGVREGGLVATPAGMRPGEVGRFPFASLPKTLDVAEPAAAPGQAVEIEVTNAFALEQWVFVNGALAGSVPPADVRVFPAAPGATTVRCADDASGKDNVASVPLELAPGQRARISVVPKL